MSPRISKRSKIDDDIRGDDVDPDAQAFLALLDRQTVLNPQRLTPFGGETARRADVLVAGMIIDLDAPLDDG